MLSIPSAATASIFVVRLRVYLASVDRLVVGWLVVLFLMLITRALLSAFGAGSGDSLTWCVALALPAAVWLEYRRQTFADRQSFRSSVPQLRKMLKSYSDDKEALYDAIGETFYDAVPQAARGTLSVEARGQLRSMEEPHDPSSTLDEVLRYLKVVQGSARR